VFCRKYSTGIAAIVKKCNQALNQLQRIQNAKEKAGLFQTKDNTTLDFEAATALNLEIAENCLTKIKGESMNQIVLDASKKKSLATLSIYKNKNNFH
jgi:hypothetical protein